MTRSLALLVLSYLFLTATFAVAQKADRIVFADEGGKGHFENTKGDAWVEHTPNGDKYTFTETSRNKDFIELHDKSRKVMPVPLSWLTRSAVELAPRTVWPRGS
jgi:hypothetical protein